MRTWDWGKASTEANEGNEGDSVGETPTGATGTVAVPEGLGRNQLRASLKARWGPIFAEKAGWRGRPGWRRGDCGPGPLTRRPVCPPTWYPCPWPAARWGHRAYIVAATSQAYKDFAPN